jgi:pyruvate dehydrogenase E1 component
VQADVWSCPSFNELARDGQDVARWNLLHRRAPRVPFVTQQLAHAGPVIASTDYMKNYAEQIRAFIPRPHLQGAGHRRLRPQRLPRKLREHFEVNRHYIVVAALKALADEGLPMAKVARRSQVRHPHRQDQPAVRLKARETRHGIGQIKVPDIGDFDEVGVIELLVKWATPSRSSSR